MLYKVCSCIIIIMIIVIHVCRGLGLVIHVCMYMCILAGCIYVCVYMYVIEKER